MAFIRAPSLGRAASLPTAGEVSARRSLDCPLLGAARSHRGSIDIKASQAEPVLATSVLSARARDGLHLEVGRSVDVNEQRRRLEQYWNTEDPAGPAETDADIESDTGYSEAAESEAGIAPRTHLEERWRALSNQQSTSASARHPTGRRKRFHSAATLRRQRHSQRRARLLLDKRAVQAGQDVELVGELADQQFLQKLTCKCTTRSASREKAWVHDLLSRDSELRLGRIVQLGLQTKDILDSREKELGHSLSSEEQEAAAGVHSSCINLRFGNQLLAQQLFIRFNVRLLHKVAKAFEGRGMDLEDLVVEGTQGLQKAIARFDPAKGYKFSTYAYMWIRQAVSRSICEHARLIRLPGHVYEMLGRIQKVRDMLAKDNPDREVTDREVAAVLGEPVEKISLYRQAGRAPISLEQTVQSPRQQPQDESLQLAETLPDPAPTAMEELLEEDSSRLLKQDIDNVLSGLSLRERNVLRYRYGLLSDAMSVADLSAAYGVSKERIRSIGEVALAKLQLRQASKGKAMMNGRMRDVPILRPELYRYR